MKGFTKIDNKSLFSKELGVYTKLVLMGLTYFTRNGTGKCFCRKSTLASYLNLSLYQVRVGLVELENLGLIHIQRVGQGNPDIITLNDLTSRNENSSSSFHYIEEEVQLEEEKNISTKNVEISIPKDDEPTPDKDLEPDIPEIPINSTNSTTKPKITHKKPPNPHHQPSQTPPPMPEHLQTLTTIKSRIKPLLRDASYNYFFSNISVVDETDNTISLTTPHGENIANFIYYTYSSKISKLVGKDVKILTS